MAQKTCCKPTDNLLIQLILQSLSPKSPSSNELGVHLGKGPSLSRPRLEVNTNNINCLESKSLTALVFDATICRVFS